MIALVQPQLEFFARLLIFQDLLASLAVSDNQLKVFSGHLIHREGKSIDVALRAVADLQERHCLSAVYLRLSRRTLLIDERVTRVRLLSVS